MILSDIKNVFKVKSVIFDMDGVITNTMPDHFDAWQIVMLERGIRVTHLDIYRREGQRGITSVKEIFEDYNHPFDLDSAEEILKRKEIIFKEKTRKRFISGTRSFVKYLKNRGFDLAIVTGTSRHELHEILPDDFYKLFKVVVTGNDIKNGKPSPEPYLLALDKLGIKAGEAVVIENAPFGIASAKAAGIRCLALATSLPGEYLKDADLIFSSIKDLRSRVKFERREN